VKLSRCNVFSLYYKKWLTADLKTVNPNTNCDYAESNANTEKLVRYGFQSRDSPGPTKAKYVAIIK
jgi:hypothetical protein